MSFLSDGDIIKNLGKKIKIDPFKEENLTPNGYDLSISEIFYGGKLIKNGKCILKKHDLCFGSTLENISVLEKFSAQLFIKSSWQRKGILSSFGKIDVGFNGNLTFNIFNASNVDVEFNIGDKYCQIVFCSLKNKSLKDYTKRSGNYQNQKGITLEKNKESVL